MNVRICSRCQGQLPDYCTCTVVLELEGSPLTLAPPLTTRQKLRAIVDLEVARLHSKTSAGEGLDKIEIIELATLLRAVGLDEEEDLEGADNAGESDEELLAQAESG